MSFVINVFEAIIFLSTELDTDLIGTGSGVESGNVNSIMKKTELLF